MKKLLLLFAALVLSVGAVAARDRVTTDVKALPQAAQTALAKYFPKTQVNHIKIDKDVFDTDYDVVLENGTEIDFDKDGNIKEVDCGSSAVPDALVLKPIRDYVAKNFKGQKIVGLEVNRKDYEIQLSNGVDLKFDRSGKFLRIDD